MEAVCATERPVWESRLGMEFNCSKRQVVSVTASRSGVVLWGQINLRFNFYFIFDAFLH